MQLIRVVVSHFLADRLLRDFVDILIVAYVDRFVNKQEIDELTLVLVDNISEHLI